MYVWYRVQKRFIPSELTILVMLNGILGMGPGLGFPIQGPELLKILQSIFETYNKINC